MQNSGLMTSLRMDWRTPSQLFEILDREFHFTLDACAEEGAEVTKEFFCNRALQRPWVPVENGAVWCNPPYGRKIGDWVEKGHRESLTCGSAVVMLLPARTDTQWWHDYCMKGEIRFIRGRLRFDESKKDAPFPSAIVIFRA